MQKPCLPLSRPRERVPKAGEGKLKTAVGRFFCLPVDNM